MLYIWNVILWVLRLPFKDSWFLWNILEKKYKWYEVFESENIFETFASWSSYQDVHDGTLILNGKMDLMLTWWLIRFSSLLLYIRSLLLPLLIQHMSSLSVIYFWVIKLMSPLTYSYRKCLLHLTISCIHFTILSLSIVIYYILAYTRY